MNPYEKCPVFENENYLLRFVEAADAADLLLVYSDTKAVPIFNSDNCTGDFYMTSIGDVERMIWFWQQEYRNGYYVRWSIVDKNIFCVVGTIELFNRESNDYFNNCGLLRLDLRSDYERQESISEILDLILQPAFEMFACEMIATKVPAIALERIRAVEASGFALSEEELVGGKDGTRYSEYFVLQSGPSK